MLVISSLTKNKRFVGQLFEHYTIAFLFFFGTCFLSIIIVSVPC